MLSAIKQLEREPRKFIYNAGVESVLEYNQPEKVLRKRVNPKLIISPFIPNIEGGLMEIVGENLGGLLRTWSFEKNRSNPGGLLNITISADERAIERFLKSHGLYQFFGSLWNTFGSSIRDIFQIRAMVQFWLDDFHVCTGFITSVVKSTDERSRTYTISIDELGNIYNEAITSPDLLFDLRQLHVIDSASKPLELAGPIPMLPLSLALQKLFLGFQASTLLYGTKGWPLPYLIGSDKVPMAFRLITMPAPLGGVSNNSIISQIVSDYSYISQNSGTPFWSYMKSICPEGFMELFCETGGRTICVSRFPFGGVSSAAGNLSGGLGLSVAQSILGSPLAALNVTPMLPGFCYTIARTVPYDNPLLGPNWAWVLTYTNLLGPLDLLTSGDFVIISDRDIKSKNIGSTGADQYTVFNVDLSAKEGSGESSAFKPAVAGGPIFPIFPGGIRTFGSRTYKENMNITSLKFAGIFGEVLDRTFMGLGLPGLQYPRVVLTDCLQHWHRNKMHFKEGTFTTRPIPYARPGMCLIYWPDLATGRIDDPREMGLYYIDSVKTEGEIGKGGSTTMSVIRGCPFPINFNNIMDFLFQWDLGLDLPSIVDGAIRG